MKVTINVTAGDIAHGVAGDCVLCPVALAALRALPAVPLAVGPQSLWLGPPGSATETEVPLPQAARSFIGRYDGAVPVEPFSFVLDVPDHLIPQEATS